MAIHEADHAEVHLCCLESREQMLADDIEVEEAEEEGVVRHKSVGPLEVLRDAEGHITGLRFSVVTSLFDEEGRFSPTFDHEQSEIIECDTVLVSIGQVCDLSFLGEQHGLQPSIKNSVAEDRGAGTGFAADQQKCFTQSKQSTPSFYSLFSLLTLCEISRMQGDLL